MLKKTSIAFALAVLLTAGSACAQEAPNPPAAAQEQSSNLWLTDPELMFQICRSDLEGLGEIDGKIYVFGHKKPDTDTVCCSIIYADLLNKLGYDAQAYILEPVNHETAFILKEAGVEVPPILDDASGKNVILVDHSDYAQSAPGLEDAKILSIIDHHSAGTVTTGNQLIFDSRPFCRDNHLAALHELQRADR